MASYSKMKVKVGQIWGRPGYAFKLIITRIKDNEVFYTDIEGKSPGTGMLCSDGTPNGWDDGWVIEKEAPASPPSSLLDFFKGVPAGYCPCNILKEQCRYHR